MRHYASHPPPAPAAVASESTSTDWSVIRSVLPYLWHYKWRMVFALLFLVGAKVSNVSVPLVLKQLIDGLNQPSGVMALMTVPLGLLAGYGALRITTTVCTELRELLFARVTQRAVRTIALQVFSHLHALSLRFHLNRQTGGLTRDIERGTRGISSLMSYTLFNIIPTLVEITLVLGYLLWHYDGWFASITLGALLSYIAFTVTVTNWRTHFRREMNALDSQANVTAIDSLINYETVKYFGNEAYEAQRYDRGLQQFESAAVKSQRSLSLLNTGQASIIAIAVTLILWRATVGVLAGTMTLGDVVLVNTFMIQLYIPLNFLGVIYREIRQSLTDMDRLFGLLKQPQEVMDVPHPQPFPSQSDVVNKGLQVEFRQVAFHYDANRPILFGIDLTLPAGSTTAIVGHSGSGKSTLARLLFRFYDVTAGAIHVNGIDIRQLKQSEVRQAIGIVPQDTVLFNDTIAYNIAYGRPDATHDEVTAVAQAAAIHDFIMRLPDGYQTQVGERGLKLSGGEKQRVAIARALLKNPAILILDEATSALDSHAEQAIQSQLNTAAQGRTTLMIAHRLSTIIHADQIVVMDQGRIVERGTHGELLARNGLYTQLWMIQQASID
jgi:ABC-type transport system involved in Fe-S cluster assembly fused permease/ATPase subunit